MTALAYALLACLAFVAATVVGFALGSLATWVLERLSRLYVRLWIVGAERALRRGGRR